METLPHRFVSLTLVAVSLTGWSARTDAQPRPAVDDGAYRGYLAVQRSTGGGYAVIEEMNADGLFVPASVLKVLTVAAALEHLGADYRWVTRLQSSGATTDAVVDGDLVIEPGADPTWGDDFLDGGADRALSALVGQVRARGVTGVTGDLVIDAGRFPGRPHPTDRSTSDLPYRFGTPAAALALDEATIPVRVAPGASIGESARVWAPAGVEILNYTTTVGRHRHGRGTLDFIPVWGTNTLLLRGEYPISEGPFSVSASDPAPALRAALRLREALAAGGVSVAGLVRQRRWAPDPRPVETIAELRSPPLGDLLTTILTRSHNWYADMLTLTLAKEVAGTGRFDDGVEVIADFVTSLHPDDRRTRARLWIRDGSGLSPANLLTPRTVVGLFGYILEQPWGQTLVEALARPGVGTLTAWPSMPPIVAKTGTLRHTVSLAGVLDVGPTQPPVLFAYFVNHHPARRWAARQEIASALRRWQAGVFPP